MQRSSTAARQRLTIAALHSAVSRRDRMTSRANDATLDCTLEIYVQRHIGHATGRNYGLRPTYGGQREDAHGMPACLGARAPRSEMQAVATTTAPSPSAASTSSAASSGSATSAASTAASIIVCWGRSMRGRTIASATHKQTDVRKWTQSPTRESLTSSTLPSNDLKGLSRGADEPGQRYYSTAIMTLDALTTALAGLPTASMLAQTRTRPPTSGNVQFQPLSDGLPRPVSMLTTRVGLLMHQHRRLGPDGVASAGAATVPTSQP